jgi:hypothetical protein
VANNSLSSIRSALNTQLSAVTELQDVKSGRIIEFSGFPACRFYLISTENELKTNAPDYWRTYTFAIDIFQETSQKANDTAEANFQDAIDAVMDKLNAEWLLDDNVDVSSVQTGSVELREINAGPCLVMTFQFAARTLIS